MIVTSGAELAAGFARAGVRILAIERTDPLPSGALTAASLPARVDVTIASTEPSGAVDLMTLKDVPLTAASVALGQYRLDIDDLVGRLIVIDELSQATTTIWSDGRFQADGQAEARFWGTISLDLADGGFITAATVARADNPDQYVLDTLTITKGVAALIVKGVGGESGDLTVAASLGGQAVERSTSDGLVLVDEADGSGWRQEKVALAADAAYLALTNLGAEYGPNSGSWSGREFGRVISAFNRLMVSSVLNTNMSRLTNHLADMLRDDQRSTAQTRSEARRSAELRAVEHAMLLAIDRTSAQPA